MILLGPHQMPKTRVGVRQRWHHKSQWETDLQHFSICSGILVNKTFLAVSFTLQDYCFALCNFPPILLSSCLWNVKVLLTPQQWESWDSWIHRWNRETFKVISFPFLGMSVGDPEKENDILMEAGVLAAEPGRTPSSLPPSWKLFLPHQETQCFLFQFSQEPKYFSHVTLYKVCGLQISI